MSYTVTQESFDTLTSCWTDPNHHLNWNSVFVLPVWLKVWWDVFGTGAELCLRAVRQGEKIIGIAPLITREGRTSLLGSADVCDYLDFIVTPGLESDFFNMLLDYLREQGISHLDLGALRPDSTALTYLEDIARKRGYHVTRRQEDVSVELDLPATWEGYLEKLATKQRHEVRRKLRRLTEAGTVDYHFINDSTAANNAMGTFLKLFTESREDKASFLTARRESFFRSLVKAMADAGLLRFGILELDKLPAAMIMCFDYNNCMYLYNSGYDLQFDYLSVGLLSKVLCIKESIKEGKQRFDFLKGNDIYKYRLGGKEVPLYRCEITIS